VFDEIPTPVNQDNADYLRVIPAGETREIVAVGEFIYVKAADFAVDVVINEKTTRMEPGDFRRLGSKFRGINVKNPDPLRPVSVEVVVGFGEFDRKIITGSVRAQNWITGVSGERPDSRQTVSMIVEPFRSSSSTVIINTILKKSDTPYIQDGSRMRMFNTKAGFGIYEENDALLVLMDDQFGLIESLTMAAVGGTNRQDGTEVNGEIYVIGLDRKIYNVKSPDVLFDVGAAFGANSYVSMQYDENRKQFYISDASNDRVLVLSDTFELITEFSESIQNPSSIRHDPVTDLLWVIRGADYTIFDPDDFSVIETDSHSYDLTDTSQPRFALKNDYVYIPKTENSDGDPVTAWQIAGRTVELKPTAIAERQSKWRILSDFGELKHTAQVSASTVTDGAIYSGELIKFLLESFYKKAMPAAYLDHVYSVVSDDLSLNVNEGTNSLELRGILDNFSLKIPARVSVTLDAQLQPGGAI